MSLVRTFSGARSSLRVVTARCTLFTAASRRSFVPQRTLVALQHKFYARSSLEDRGRALEDRAVREHDAQLLEALRKSLANAKKFSAETEGEPNTLQYRIFLTQQGKRMSPWHDVPLQHDPATFNFINEMPKGTDAKMEIATDEKWTPIRQDTKGGQLRFIKHGKSGFNYGMLPQTWENPAKKLPGTEYGGDDDPLDVVELSGEQLPLGAVVPVRVLGALALIDEGELDWKLLAISTESPLAKQLHDVADLDLHLPGAVDTIRDWYRVYKVADGKGENSFALDGKPINKAAALKVIDECHAEWKAHKRPTQ